ncbi:Bug family tripartite tricarboxylate transporter substrate binding protein [Variovorax sp. GB1P17]|uniref:Bug family tripartite tricarboxylate transporter substrate binding protein n=1 Tax=Variovorax sp. GB1P17 TaxID=3443740 RepID=UPI003F47E707
MRVLAILALVGWAGSGLAQAWPPATVRIVVPYPPGTEPDILARDLGNSLSRQTGKTFVVDNRPGANSMVGTQEVVKGDAEGGVLLMVDRLAVVTNPFLFATVPYRWEDTLKPVSDLAKVDLFVAVNSAFPAKTYAEFITYAKANPGKVNVGTGGNGHVMHIGMAMVAQAHDLAFTYVPYKGGAPAMLGLAAGEVDAMMAGSVTMGPYVQTKKIRALAYGGLQRSPAHPEVPTVIEAGGKADSIPSTAFALLAPAKVPDAVVSKISAAVAISLARPELRESYSNRGMEAAPSSPANTLAAMRRDSAKFERIIRQAGIKVE